MNNINATMCVISIDHLFADKTVIIVKHEGLTVNNKKLCSMTYKNALSGFNSDDKDGRYMFIKAPSNVILKIKEQRKEKLENFLRKIPEIPSLRYNHNDDDEVDGFSLCCVDGKGSTTHFETENYIGEYGDIDEILKNNPQCFTEESKNLISDLKTSLKPGDIVIGFRAKRDIKNGHLQIWFEVDDWKINIPTMHETDSIHNYNCKILIDARLTTGPILRSALEATFELDIPHVSIDKKQLINRMYDRQITKKEIDQINKICQNCYASYTKDFHETFVYECIISDCKYLGMQLKITTPVNSDIILRV